MQRGNFRRRGLFDPITGVCQDMQNIRCDGLGGTRPTA